jgi:serine protease AprX
MTHPATAEALTPPRASDVVLEFGARPAPESIRQFLGKDFLTMPDYRMLETLLLKAQPNQDRPWIQPLTRILQQRQITQLRDTFYQLARPIASRIDNRITKSSSFAEMVDAGAGVAELCWLNGTVRAKVQPGALADIAAETAIDRIGLPRRLSPEATSLGAAVGAPGYRMRKTRSGKGIAVAVIDFEATEHPAYKDRLVKKNNYTKESWGNPDPHGTAVAGIVGGSHADFTGIAPEATLYNYKVLATNRELASDDFGGGVAIQQALEDGAHIANCSWGAGPATDGTSRLARACDTAWALGLAIVKSAGNKGPGAGTVTSPADADGIIVVGATGNDGAEVQDYSSRGPCGAKERPHLVAPGGSDIDEMFSCLIAGDFGGCGVGTSYAAPHVSGLLALILEGDHNLSPDELKTMLVNACNSMGADANSYGAGLVTLAKL